MADEKEVKDRDAHNRERIAQTIQKNAGLIFGVIIVAALGWGASWGYSHYLDSLDRDARVEFYRVETEIDKIGEELFKTAAESMKDTKDAVLPEIAKTPESFEKNYRILAEELEVLIQEHSGKRSALVSALYLADLYTEHGMNDQAEKLLESVDTQAAGDAVVVGLVRTQLAGLQSTSGKCDKAVGIYEDLEMNASYEFLLPQILLRKVACLIEMGKNTEAQADLDRLKAEFESTDAGRRASIYERLLQLKSRSTN